MALPLSKYYIVHNALVRHNSETIVNLNYVIVEIVKYK
jgi:hypothetical protein